MANFSLWLLLTTLLSSAAAGDTHRNSKVTCAHLKRPCIPGAEVISITGTELLNHTVPSTPRLLPEPITGLDIYAIDVVLTHKSANDKVLVKVWMSLDDWNGKFQANGGSGYAAGALDLSLGPSAKQGYSAASTDAGVGFDPQTPGA